MTLLTIEIPYDIYFSYSKVLCNKVKFTIVQNFKVNFY